LARKIQHQRLRWSRLNNTSANVLASKPGSRLLFRELIQDPYCIGNGRKHEDTDGNFLIGASGVARRSATIVPNNRLALPPSMTVRHDCSQQSFGTSAVHGGPPRLFPTIVWHFCRPWRSITHVCLRLASCWRHRTGSQSWSDQFAAPAKSDGLWAFP
jgi:hypothetical protein